MEKKMEMKWKLGSRVFVYQKSKFVRWSDTWEAGDSDCSLSQRTSSIYTGGSTTNHTVDSWYRILGSAPLIPKP